MPAAFACAFVQKGAVPRKAIAPTIRPFYRPGGDRMGAEKADPLSARGAVLLRSGLELIALYEHKVFTQGWSGGNSFEAWSWGRGVSLEAGGLNRILAQRLACKSLYRGTP